ncbi:MAG: hypothetical protein IJP17_04070, partial [Clostridia bacterium]|nr:hypothetical protein [Clostridia bacterium]
MGTDNGIMIDHCIALLIIPYILAAVYRISSGACRAENEAYAKMALNLRNTATALLLSITIVSGVCFNLTFAYCEDYVLTLNTPSELEVFTGMKTSEERAAAISELALAAAPYKGEDTKLIVFGAMPMAHSILDMKPYLGTGWPDLLSFTPDKLDSRLTAGEESGELPLVLFCIRRTGNIPGAQWPNTGDNGVLRGAKYDIMMDFISRNDYSEVYRSDNYIIYAPNDSLGGEEE